MIPASNTTGQNCMGTLVLLHSRRPTQHRADQSVRDGRRPCGARLWRKTTHGDASHAAGGGYQFGEVGSILRAPGAISDTIYTDQYVPSGSIQDMTSSSTPGSR